MIARFRSSSRHKWRLGGVAWAAGVSVAVLGGLAATARLHGVANAPTLSLVDSAIERALGAPTGVLAVLNPVNCSLGANDAAELNKIAAVPGMRVTVLLLAVGSHDSLIKQVRDDFSFSTAVSLKAASQFDPSGLPTVFRQPFVAVLKRGQLRHTAWGDALKSLSAWLPVVAGVYPSIGAEAAQ